MVGIWAYLNDEKNVFVSYLGIPGCNSDTQVINNLSMQMK